MNTNEDKIRRLCQQNKEKDDRIRELEDKLQQVKIDEINMYNFKASAEKERIEMEESIINMYANLHLFQQAVSTVVDQHSHVEERLTQFNTIWEIIGFIDQWIIDNPDAPSKIYRPSKMERKTNIHS